MGNHLDYGEKVTTKSTQVYRLDTTWDIKVEVFYTGRFYNVLVHVREKTSFLKSGDSYRKSERADTEEEISDVGKGIIEDIFDSAKGRKKARELDINISVE